MIKPLSGAVGASITLLPSRAMLSRQVFFALHFNESAGGSLELEGDVIAAVQVGGRRGSGNDQIDVAVVELIDERDEAACFVFV
jgi:hypothetical protein